LGPRRYHVGVLDAFGGHLKPERTERSILYRNLGGRRFEDVTREAGLVDDAWTGDASPMDLNEDGFPDLYVLNMQGHDQYYENAGGVRFSRKTRAMFPKTPWAPWASAPSISTTTATWTDGHRHALDMSEEVGPELEKLKSRMVWDERFLRSGAMRFTETRSTATMEGKLTRFGRHRRRELLALGFSVWRPERGRLRDVFIASGMNFPLRYGVNSLLLNDRGAKFRDSEFILGVEPRRGGRAAGPAFLLDASGENQEHPLVKAYGLTGEVEVWGSLASRASAIFDLDADGDLDIVTNEFNDGPMVLVSDLSERKPIRFLKVKLVGRISNRSGIGARVAVSTSGSRYTQVNDGKSGYLSQSDLPLYFGLGDAATVEAVRVLWPSGEQQSLPGPIETNRLLEIREP
jgi:hypothetical protein